jgi:hypothetical protein
MQLLARGPLEQHLPHVQPLPPHDGHELPYVMIADDGSEWVNHGDPDQTLELIGGDPEDTSTLGALEAQGYLFRSAA